MGYATFCKNGEVRCRGLAVGVWRACWTTRTLVNRHDPKPRTIRTKHWEFRAFDGVSYRGKRKRDLVAHAATAADRLQARLPLPTFGQL